MGAPEYVPVAPTDQPRSYRSPEVVPESWWADRPGEVGGRQPVGSLLGYQGPDQGYALTLAELVRPRLVLAPGEGAGDVLSGAVGIGLRRASGFGRAPVVHDLTVALTIFGFLDAAPPAELVVLRGPRFSGVGDRAHHYLAWRALVDSVPGATLHLTHGAVAEAYPARWRELVGA